jgi:hypothetical protein
VRDPITTIRYKDGDGKAYVRTSSPRVCEWLRRLGYSPKEDREGRSTWEIDVDELGTPISHAGDSSCQAPEGRQRAGEDQGDEMTAEFQPGSRKSSRSDRLQTAQQCNTHARRPRSKQIPTS